MWRIWMIYAIINLTIDYRRSSDECDKREKKIMA